MTSSAPRTVCYDWAKTFSLHPRRGRQHLCLTAEPVVIDYETFCKIHDCHDRQGLTIAQTARALGLHPQTVATWVARSRFEPRRSRPRGSVLDPFKPRVTRLLDTHPYSAQQIFQRLHEEGYRGGNPAGLHPPHPANQAAGLSQAALCSRRVCAGRLGCLRNRRGGQYASPAFVLRYGAGLQPPDVCGVHRLPDHGAFPRLPRTRLCGPGWRAVQNHGRPILNRRFCSAWPAPLRCSIRAISTLPATTALRSRPAMSPAATRRGAWSQAWATSKRISCMGSS